MIRITANVSDEAGETLRSLISSLTGPEASALSEGGGITARNAAIKYHRDFDRSGGWKGKRFLGDSSGQGSGFGANVARGWMLESFDPTGATISNDAEHYAFKVSGGTIRPKRAKALTIPLIPEARGKRASVYSQDTGRRLFTIKGKNALFERIDSITIGPRGRRGQGGGTQIRTNSIRPVYALLQSVTMGPWAGALPPDDLIADAFIEGYQEGIMDIIEES